MMVALGTTIGTGSVWMSVLEIGGPAVAIIFALAGATIMVFRFGINPGLKSYADIISTHRDGVIESRVSAEASKDAAASSKEAASAAVSAVERLEAVRLVCGYAKEKA